MSATPSMPAGVQPQTGQKPPAQKPSDQKPSKPPGAPASPLGLDDLLRVTGPRIWIGLLALLTVVVGILVWSIVGVIPQIVPGDGMLLRADVQKIMAPTDGSIKTVAVTEDQQVKAGDVVATLLSADGAVVDLKASQDGLVTGINIPPGFPVKQGDAIMTIEDTSVPLLGVVYVPLSTGKQITPGMKVQLAPSVVDTDNYGYLTGVVNAISEFPITQDDLLGGAMAAVAASRQLGEGGPVLRLIVNLDTADTPSGYNWSSSKGPNYELRNGTATQARIIIGESRPIEYFLPLGQ
ncbi:MAG: biotin/lipoyl-binding protein [Tetrasphaera sp.]